MRALPGLVAVALAVIAASSLAAETVVERKQIVEWKSVFGRVEARDRVPARSRLGGTLVSLKVEEGARVRAGEVLATVDDEKLRIRLDAIDAQAQAIEAQLENARTELKRGESLLERGVTTVQRLDQLRTQVTVLEGELEAVQAERRVVVQQASEGDVLAPITGVVLTVPVTTGAVVLPGEVIAEIGGGGMFLRLAVPERHAEHLEEGDEILIARDDAEYDGRLDKIYPQIDNGRVVADVEVEGLGGLLVDARVLVRLPVGRTDALVVPAEALETRFGLDFVPIKDGDRVVMRSVVVGERQTIDGIEMVRILSGLEGGEIVAVGHE